MSTVFATDLSGFPPPLRGKVRDVYDLGDRLLIVATDRLSAFDVVLPTPIPDKGRILTQLSLFWFRKLASVVTNHVIGEDLSGLGLAAAQASLLAGRAMVVEKLAILPVECVVRGYLAGGGWKEYRAEGRVSGLALPAGLREAERLAEPIFTPSTKAERGRHDEPIAFDRVEALIGRERAERVRDLSLALYRAAAAHAEAKGLIVADTKFEFGLRGEEVVLADEALTPDSSRFWPADSWAPGRSPPSFDKQYVRDWLERCSGWDKSGPPPALPEDVVARTRAKYLEAYRRLVGRDLA